MATSGFAATLLAVNDASNTLVSIDTDTSAVTTIGALGTGLSFGGLAYDGNSGTLYMVGGRSNNSLYTVDTGTGAATLVGSHGITDMFGLAFDTTNNVLYGSVFGGNTPLYTIDTATGAATASTPAMSARIGSLGYNSTNDTLYGLSAGSGDLFEIDRTSGAQTLLGNGGFVNNAGLAVDDSTGIVFAADHSGNLFSYDPNNAFARTTLATGLGQLTGLTVLAEAPPAVPLPAGLPLLIGGIAAFGFMRRRKTA
ncbi:VPLPA-CTERM sorting domain-containing protein [uncultured Tateyamaria sp.]|uniref:VPLPA-CTERM sorting domain-containing protein n=1 Tax=uncultured Tateyamaria sp. TaxID=455651 RepID=UPI00261B4425|nr:VPLPA-CTERM sorting domain-containing protein [uncultured Tateyamaria sp.]